MCLALEASLQGHGPVWAGPEEATAMMRLMEALSCESRLRELDVFSLEKRSSGQFFFVAFWYLKGMTRKMGTGFLTGPVMTERSVGFKTKWRRFRPNGRKKSFTLRAVKPCTSCSERWGMLHPWKHWSISFQEPLSPLLKPSLFNHSSNQPQASGGVTSWEPSWLLKTQNERD